MKGTVRHVTPEHRGSLAWSHISDQPRQLTDPIPAASWHLSLGDTLHRIAATIQGIALNELRGLM